MDQRQIAVLTEHNVCRDCLVDHLGRGGDRQVRAWARAASLLRHSRVRPFDLVLVDLALNDDDPAAVIAGLRRISPLTTVVALGSPTQLAALPVDVDGAIDMTRAGLGALLSMARALDEPHRGRLRFPLSAEVQRQRELWRRVTQRQRQVLALLGRGDGNQQLADELGISERSVKAHVSQLMLRFQVTSRAKLAVIAHQAALPGTRRGADLMASG